MVLNTTIIMSNNSSVIQIPVYRPFMSGREKEYVCQCLDTKWISSKGEFVGRFERGFSEYIKVKHSSTVSNGTVALHIALAALGIGAGDEVIVPTFTYIASVNAIAYVGATPIFVDAEQEFWNIDPDKIIEKITPKTKAVMIVHIYGAPCEVDKIADICKKHNLLLIEDVAEAFGSKYKGQFAGSFGDIATFSFFGNKTITTGEGGMVVSNQKSLIDRVSFLKSQAVSASKEYWHDEIGYNYRMTNICAAIGVAQLEQADDIILKKRYIADLYKSELAGTSITFQKDAPYIVNTFWMISILAQNQEIRDRIRLKLRDNGIETRPFFYPAHMMPAFRQNDTYPVAESLSERGINLPSYPDLDTEQIKYICSIIKTF